MKARILVLGNTGMLGHIVMKFLSEDSSFRVDGTHLSGRNDIFYFNAVDGLKKLDLICKKNKGYDYFINCIGITKDKIEEDIPGSVLAAIKVNSIFPHELASLAEKNGTKVIHISTDGIFSGSCEKYDEDSPSDCTDVYGKTKSLGEAKSVNFLNIRCSIIGPSPLEKRGLFEWFRSQPEGSKIYGYRDHFWNGVTTLQFAELCKKIILKNSFDRIMEESCVHHFCPNQIISKYELLGFFKTVIRKKIEIIPIKNKTIPFKRILITKYRALKNIFGNNANMRLVIKKLCKYA